MKYANPAPLGLTGFATTTWLLSMINAGWFDATSIPMVLAMALAFGGTAQFVAGVLEYPRGNTFGFVAFCGYGAFWWTYALFVQFFSAQVPATFVGWYLFVWGVFTFFMWFGALRANRALQLVFLALWVTFLLLALGEWVSPILAVAGGYVGLLTALFAIYLAAADIINEAHGRTVLPIHPYTAPAEP